MPPKKKLKSSTQLPIFGHTQSLPHHRQAQRQFWQLHPSTSNPETRAATPLPSKNRVGGSFIWDYGSEFIDSQGVKCWKCGLCSAKTPPILPLMSTSNQRYHLRAVHHITDPAESKDDDQQTTLDTHLLKPFLVEIMRKWRGGRVLRRVVTLSFWLVRFCV